MPDSAHAPCPLGCEIIVPLYRALGRPEAILLTHNIMTLRAWPVTLIGPHQKADMLNTIGDQLAQDTGAHVAVKTFADPFFSDLNGYNKLLLAPKFYSAFSHQSHILICQTDAVIVEDCLEEWMQQGYSFVGAPHFEGYQSPVEPRRFLRSLNGGLSLRHVADARMALRRVVRLRSKVLAATPLATRAIRGLNQVLPHLRLVAVAPRLFEDIFWTDTVPAILPEFRIPPPEVAMRFAFETCPAELYEMTGHRLPLGAHAVERYDPGFWQSHLPQPVAAAIREMASDRAAVQATAG